MPLYDYECKKCETVVEVKHAHNAKHEKCETCGGEVARIFSGAPTIKYGCDGFYNTDYKPYRRD